MPKENYTQKKLLEERKTIDMPDPSFDLNGDGIVSSKEYVIAKRFDQDRDGKLNSKERKNAIKALNNGYEDNFVWNIEKSGPYRGQRIIQMRGQIIDADDYSKLKLTYPTHPLSTIEPKVKSRTELVKIRKEKNVKLLNKNKEDWDKLNPTSVPQEFKLSEFLVAHPK